jgi:PAS domain S-box-containing protein
MKLRTEPKTKQQLMHKLSELSKRVAELEASEAECKHAEEALRESKERYGLATKSGQVGVWDWNLETNEIYLDPNLKAMLGYADHEIRNHLDDWGTYVHPDDVESVMAEAQAHLDGLTAQYEVVHRMLHKDGSIRWFLARGNAIRDANGKPYRVLGTDTDVTERKQAEDALQRAHAELETRVAERTAALMKANEQLKREIEERKEAEREREELTFLIEQSSEFIGISTLEGEILYLNPAGQRLLGIESREETKTRTVADYVNKEDLGEYRERILPSILQHGHWEGEFLMRHSRTGEPIPVELSGFLINDPESGQPIAMATVSRDITERKQAEKALRESEERFRKLFDFAPDAYYLNDLKGNFVDGNRAAQNLIGYKKEELIGKNFLKLALLPPSEVPKAAAALDRNIQGKPTGPEELILNRKDGTQVTVEISTLPVKIEGQTLVLGIARNISKRKEIEQVLIEREKELEIKTSNVEEANAALKVLLKRREEDKTELEEKMLLNVKDLVQPYIEKLKGSGLTERQKVYADILESNLNNIISPFSRTLSSHYFNLSPTEIQVANLVRDGKTNKEIAELLNSSPRTIGFHRENIRKKLDLKNKKVNLQAHLQFLTSYQFLPGEYLAVLWGLGLFTIWYKLPKTTVGKVVSFRGLPVHS